MICPGGGPNKLRSGVARTREVFGDKIIKNMEIPWLIDEYNHHMGGVDIFDQLKSYYDILRAHRKTWRPLFSYLLEIILSNSFKLSTFSEPAEIKRSGHRRFLFKLVNQLGDAAGKAVRYDARRHSSINDLKVRNGDLHVQGKLYEHYKPRPWVMCQSKGQRNPLQAMDANQASARRPSSTRTSQGCVQCNVTLCNKCCKEHLQDANSTENTDSESTVE